LDKPRYEASFETHLQAHRMLEKKSKVRAALVFATQVMFWVLMCGRLIRAVLLWTVS
jgi:hypothetical protein